MWRFNKIMHIKYLLLHLDYNNCFKMLIFILFSNVETILHGFLCFCTCCKHNQCQLWEIYQGSVLQNSKFSWIIFSRMFIECSLRSYSISFDNVLHCQTQISFSSRVSGNIIILMKLMLVGKKSLIWWLRRQTLEPQCLDLNLGSATDQP